MAGRIPHALRALLRPLKRTRLARSAIASPWFPGNWRSTLRLCRILAVDYAHLSSVASNRAIDVAGNPLPWYTYPAIEFLRQIDFSRASVFEYGCGQSTMFWSSLAERVVSVEDDENWYAIVAAKLPSNCHLLLETDLDAFVASIDRFGEFDIVVIDGPARGFTRLKCARAALHHVRAGGLVILDNSDWLPQSAEVLRDFGLLQVDMTGFSPINGFTGTTSLFFHRSWNWPSRGDRRPVPGVGARIQNWEPRTTPSAGCVECRGEILAGVVADAGLTLSLPGGARTFRVLGYTRTDGTQAVAIIDQSQGRLLLTGHRHAEHSRGSRARTLEDEVERIQRMSADRFAEFINTHPLRRYTL